MPAQEGHVPSPLHADAAAVSLFDLHDFRLEIAQSVGGRLSRGVFGRQNLSVHGDALVDDGVARETLLHSEPALLAADLMVTGLKRDHQAQLVADDALLRRLQLGLDVEGRRWLGSHVTLLRKLLLAADVFR